jgi:glycosyltransferase involved in cell wall biosynthesis
MHILIIHQAFAELDEPGGTRHHEMALYLAEKGHCVTIIASAVSYLTGEVRQSRLSHTEQGEGEVNILRVPVYRTLHKSFLHRVVSFLSFMFSSFWAGLQVKKVDIIWGTSPPIFQGLTTWALARLKRARFLFEVRDLWPAFAVAVGVLTNPILIWAAERVEKFLYRRADQLMVNSPGFIPHIQSRGGKEIELIPNGADAAMFNPDDDGRTFRDAHSLGEGFVALYAGAHGMSNDLDVLLDAAAILKERKGITLVLLGDGKEKANLIQRAQEMNLENLHFIPSVTKEEMPHALAAADACISILKPIEMYKTTYPNKVFDYMAAGRANILAIDGVVRQVVETAQAGIFVPPGDPTAMAEAITQLTDDPAQTRRMGQAGRAYLEAHFDRPKLAEDLVSLLVRLLPNKIK